VGNLAHELGVKAPVVMRKLIEMGQMATINDVLDLDTASLLAGEFEYEVENVGFQEQSLMQQVDAAVEEEATTSRPPIITIMGHVDHGKTTLLDTIREARVAHGEAGGITQHIGAYQVDWRDHTLTFLDTPGHAAFSAMRARGANITDIVVLVVAADDGVQPQTVEAISHAKAAGVPIVVAVNKIDKPGVNPDTVKQRLGEYELIPEEWGGETQFVEVSALKKMNIEGLLEALLLEAEMLELGANPNRHAEGVVIEAEVKRGRGTAATILVTAGTLKKGDFVVAGTAFGRVRSISDFRGKTIKTAGPSTPVELFGLSELPMTGDALAVVETEKNARAIAEHRARAKRDAEQAKHRRRTIDDLKRLAAEAERKTVHLVLKADVQGSLEALRQSILNIEVEGAEVRILHAGVGNITESDINLIAADSGAIFGFNVKIDPRARRTADENGVKPELYKVIYDIIERVEEMMTGLLDPIYEEQRTGSAEVRALFKVSRLGVIAGSYVLDGKLGRNHSARVYRKGNVIWEGEVSGLKRFKDDVKEVSAGYECGILLDGFDEIEEGDVIETFDMVEVGRG